MKPFGFFAEKKKEYTLCGDGRSANGNEQDRGGVCADEWLKEAFERYIGNTDEVDRKGLIDFIKLNFV